MTGAHQIQLGLANLTGGLLFFPPLNLILRRLSIFPTTPEGCREQTGQWADLYLHWGTEPKQYTQWDEHLTKRHTPAVPWTHSSSTTHILRATHLPEMLCASVSESPSLPSEVSSVELHENNLRLSSPKRKKKNLPGVWWRLFQVSYHLPI